MCYIICPVCPLYYSSPSLLNQVMITALGGKKYVAGNGKVPKGRDGVEFWRWSHYRYDIWVKSWKRLREIHADISGKRRLGRGNSRCKGPEVGWYLLNLRKEAGLHITHPRPDPSSNFLQPAGDTALELATRGHSLCGFQGHYTHSACEITIGFRWALTVPQMPC